jgi:hypothetical protein
MRGAMIAYMPNGGMYAPPADQGKAAESLKNETLRYRLLNQEGNMPAPDGIYFTLGYSAPRLGATRSA